MCWLFSCPHNSNMEIPHFPSELWHFAPSVSSRPPSYCTMFVFMLILITLPRLKCVIWTPQKPAPAGDVRVTQVELPSLLGCSISLACDPHTHTHTHIPGRRGSCPLPPSPPVFCVASFHPSSPPPPLSSCLVYCQRSWMKFCQTSHIREPHSFSSASKQKKKKSRKIQSQPKRKCNRIKHFKVRGRFRFPLIGANS